jgi:archaellum component FlaC
MDKSFRVGSETSREVALLETRIERLESRLESVLTELSTVRSDLIRVALVAGEGYREPVS